MLNQDQSELGGSLVTNGRWSEKEHYLFLLAVKEYGKDWKKIESFVKTRSSTQARSHAQKVLKDELYANLDEEINRLERLYHFSDAIDSEQTKLIFNQTCMLQHSNKIKRRYSKGQSKVDKLRDNKNGYQTSNKSDEFYEIENENNSHEDDNYDDSDYSYPGDLNMKLFRIEKVIKKKSKSGRKRIKLSTNLIGSKPDEMEWRKDSMIVESKASTELSKSPRKDLINTDALIKESLDLPIQKSIMNKIEEKETIPPNNENGWQHKIVENEFPNAEMKRELKIKIWKEYIVQDNDTFIQIEQNEAPQTWKVTNYAKLDDTWFFGDIFNYGITPKIHQEENDYEINNFDKYFNIDFEPNKLKRKMTRDESKLQINNLEETFLMGDRKFPLYYLY